MRIRLDREKKLAVLRWLRQGYIDTREIAELRMAQKDVPIAIWKDWEREAVEKGDSFDLLKRLEETAGLLPITVAIDAEGKRLAVLKWLKQGFIDTDGFEEMMVTR